MVVETAQRLWRGVKRRWVVLTAIGVAWIVGGPLLLILPYGALIAFFVWVWMTGHIIIILWNAGKPTDAD